MNRFIIAVAALALGAGAAMAQQSPAASGGVSRPTIGMGSKTMASCTADKQKFCASASDYMTKECLVKNWDVITSDCQDALGSPFDGAARK
ncbi:MAG TPA: hypothetical protein VHC40_08635 [Rhizomicrobium sp.]|jgi:hypothetical protein|nr:hypothetical protein [Rhizomicrobium sp.]